MIFSAEAIGEARQVQFLPANDGAQDIADQFQVFGRKRLEQRQRVLGFFQQAVFPPGEPCWCASPPSSTGRKVWPKIRSRSWRSASRRCASGTISVSATGVRRAREQVGEADLRAHTRRQYPQRQVK